MSRTVFILFLFSAGLLSVKLAHADPRDTVPVPVLLYHHIQVTPDDASAALRRWSVTPEQFALHIQWIQQKGFTVMSVLELSQYIQKGSPLPKNPLVLTFDDGWKDHYTIVFPVLRKYHFPATFFITTESAGHSAFVTWEDLKDMAASPVADIQSHSVTHPHLTGLSDQQAYREITESRKALESHLQKPVTIFAYPFGNYSEKVIEMVKKAGYQSAVVVSGSNIGYIYRADKTYTMGRIAIEGDMTLKDLEKSIQHVRGNHED